MEKRPLLICTDPGIDDFIALSMVLARPEFDVLGMIALSGNVGLDVTVNNALLACELNGRSEIPVLAGSAKPLARPARSASNIHGKSGLGKSTELYSKDYIPYSIKYGRMTSLIGVVASFVPLIVLALVFGVMPTAKAIAAAAAIRISACLVYYFIEPISFQPVLGIPGTYMAFLSGNISNLRVPCSSVAQQAAGVQEGTPEGAVISTVGVAVSVVVNTTILTIGVLLGQQIISMIPASLVSALVYLVPALYGAMLMQMVLYAPKIAIISVPLSIIALAVSKMTGWFDSSVAILISVFGSIFIGRALMNTGWLDDQK